MSDWWEITFSWEKPTKSIIVVIGAGRPRRGFLFKYVSPAFKFREVNEDESWHTCRTKCKISRSSLSKSATMRDATGGITCTNNSGVVRPQVNERPGASKRRKFSQPLVPSGYPFRGMFFRHVSCISCISFCMSMLLTAPRSSNRASAARKARKRSLDDSDGNSCGCCISLLIS
jgi:hypothetical protein